MFLGDYYEHDIMLGPTEDRMDSETRVLKDAAENLEIK